MRQYNFYTYILTNFKQTVLYVGVTNNKLIEEENPSWRFLNGDIMEWPPLADDPQ